MTIRTDELSNLAGTGPATLTGQSAAKAWASVGSDQSTNQDSFNVSSLSDLAVGRCRISFTNNFGASTYSIGSNADGSTSATYALSTNSRAVGSADVRAGALSGDTATDVGHRQQYYGDLA